VRPTPDARVSAPLAWDEVADCDPGEFTLASMPKRFRKLGDRHADIDSRPGSIAPLLELFDKQGLGDAPWPPHYKKQAGEPARVQPSKRRKPAFPLLEIAKAKDKDDALAGLERWKKRHPKAAAHLEPEDVLVDAMRGRYTTWTRIRVNLKNVPENLRPPQEPLDPDEKIFTSS
jgi:bifunctional non-homologous end joining protein LigD